MATGFGIVGCGMIANFHAKALGDIKGANVVACFDNFPKSAARFWADEKMANRTNFRPDATHPPCAARCGQHIPSRGSGILP